MIDIAESMYDGTTKMLTGPGMLLTTLNPSDNFGLAIPINLITFVCLEFSQGTIRNKIIAGHSKHKIYASLFISGLILAFSLLFTYVGLCTLIGFAFGGFNLDEPITSLTSVVAMMSMGAKIDAIYILEMLATATVVYIAIISFTIFFATLFRSIGPCIPIVIIVIMMLAFGSYVDLLEIFLGEEVDVSAIVNIVKYLNPLYVISGGGASTAVNYSTGESFISIQTDAFIATIVNNLVYAGLFYMGGTFIFAKRDVK